MTLSQYFDAERRRREELLAYAETCGHPLNSITEAGRPNQMEQYKEGLRVAIEEYRGAAAHWSQ